jgi:hypothetical protein
MDLKTYDLKETVSVNRFGKVFCRKFGEHLGWILFKLPFKIKHHNSLIKGDAQKVVVWLRNNTFVVIEEYQVDPIELKKKHAKQYLEHYDTPPITDEVQYNAHLSNVKSYNDVLKF